MASTTQTPEAQDIARRIAEQEAELAALRRRLESRLEVLHQRREGLRAELLTIETEIESAGPSGPREEAAPSAPPVAASASAAPKRRGTGTSLAEFLVGLVREAKGEPMPVSRLKEEAVRRRYPTSSSDLPKMVETRAYELVKRGLLRRDAATGGLLLPESRNGGQASNAARPTAEPKAQPSTMGRSSTARSTRRSGQLPLRLVLLSLLRKSGRTMSVQELADQALEAGYRTTSKNLKDSVWVAMGHIPEAERDPQGGYRLKRGQR